ncbi:nicotinamidase-like amidase [Bernardetia litoralis DSM 6794]|uniref:Nicotinamidase-like amidase n=1 Tax=Bernardetia litoralis (strain ATCC 23117 / DSM 6794 / NBRC 15988 / NCIMB 1366 / Fx l1 / Sio-4) TaxID=880071 RepID=I4AJM0_BERLS|nr:isochorismatase family protein [Bernardetia litoralis]AFM04155.1 nicotinamidase-like amidase [Bernardetia litoralis DSM 6794]
MQIKKDDSLLLFIDVQEKLFPHINKHSELEKKLNQLVEGMQVLEIPIIVSEQYTKGLGKTVESITQKLDNQTPTFEKMTFSCMQNPEIATAIEQSGKRTIILAGVEAHICVLQTALDLCAEGFDVALVLDAVGSRTEENKSISVLRLQNKVAFTSVESVLFELCQVAGTEQFKAISKIIK